MNTVQSIRADSALTSPIARKLSQFAVLSDGDFDLLSEMQGPPTRLRAGVRLGLSGRGANEAFVVRSGWIMNFTELDDGRRQILNVALPGDILARARMRSSAFTVASETITRAEISPLRQVVPQHFAVSHPGLHRAFDLDTRRDAMLLASQILRLGRLTAYERVAHLIVELFERNTTIGHVDDNTMPFPLTQSVIADALGLSLVHVNRQFGQLRSDGALTLKKKRMTIHKLDALAKLANYAMEKPPSAA